MVVSIKEELSPHVPSIRPLCPTQHAESIANCKVIQQLMGLHLLQEAY